MAIFNFRANQIVLNDTTLILEKKKHFFDQKNYKIPLVLCFNNILTTSV